MRNWPALLVTLSICLSPTALGQPVGETDLAARCRSDLSALAARMDLPWDVAMEARAAAARLPALRPQFDEPPGPAGGGGAQSVAAAGARAGASSQAPRAELAAALERCGSILRKGLPSSPITARPSR